MTTSKAKTIKSEAPAESSIRYRMDPQDMKTLFESLNNAPSWLSKRFILKNLCGWSKEWIDENAQLRMEEERQTQAGNKIGGFK